MKKRLSLAVIFLGLASYVSGQEPPAVNPVEQRLNNPTGTIVNQETHSTENQWQVWTLEGAKASEDFLKLVDAGQYADSWKETSVITKLRLRGKYWVMNLERTRKPLGAVRSRSIKLQMAHMDPANLPKGPYMSIWYNTSFSGSSDSGELVTLRREDNGQWRVLTYQVLN